MNIFITSDTEFNDYVFLRRKMDALTRNLTSDPFLLTVNQKPTRNLVEKWATERFLYMQIYHSDKESYGAEADSERDKEAIEALQYDQSSLTGLEKVKCVVVAFTTGSGSEHLKRIKHLATKYNIDYRRIFYSEED